MTPVKSKNTGAVHENDDSSTEKIRHGQFYTIGNPFSHPLVTAWLHQIPHITTKTFTEPFAGANNIIRSFLQAHPHISTHQWTAYDVHPEAIHTNEVPQIPLTRRDTLHDFPTSDIIITNPPYLAKNSARRRQLDILHSFGEYQDLYEVSLDKILPHADYIAAIIPESFLTRPHFKDRLYGFISITEELFCDTETPVGIALWTPQHHTDHHIYIGTEHIGYHHDIRDRTTLLHHTPAPQISIRHNTPEGIIGLHAVDSTTTPSIRYVDGDHIAPEKVKNTSRAVTRIDITSQNDGRAIITPENLHELLRHANRTLHTYREQSADIFLTSFRGLRRDHRYRRRMDWKTSTHILHAALADMGLAEQHTEN